MGGDKTHLMLFRSDRRRSASLRTQVPNKAGIRAPTTFGDARVVAISGRQPMDHHIWEEIAHQLGKTDAFRRFWENGPAAPGEHDWADGSAAINGSYSVSKPAIATDIDGKTRPDEERRAAEIEGEAGRAQASVFDIDEVTDTDLSEAVPEPSPLTMDDLDQEVRTSALLPPGIEVEPMGVREYKLRAPGIKVVKYCEV